VEVKSLSSSLLKRTCFLNLSIINGLMLSQRIMVVKTRHCSFTGATTGDVVLVWAS